MMLHSKFPQCIVWGPELTTLYNDAFRPILGNKPEALGCSFRDVWQEAWHAIGPIVDKAYRGEGTFIEDFPLVVNRRGQPEQAYFTFSYSPIYGEGGRVLGMIDTVIETTATVEAQKHVRLLNAELAHRGQNTFALIASIIEQTFRHARSLDELRGTLTERVAALGRAHAALTQTSWRGASVDAVVHDALNGHAAVASQIHIEGPSLMLTAGQSLSLSLALHELITNAVKYGALSVPSGRVTVRWQIGEPPGDGMFRLQWSEENGPPVAEPSRAGFGTRLIQQVLAGEFAGAVNVAFQREGLRCELSAAIGNLQRQSSC